MREATIQEKLLKILFESSESRKSTATLAQELGFFSIDENNKNIVHYNYIDKDLRKLKDKGYIDGVRNELTSRGSKPTEYFIIYNIQSLSGIFDEYPRMQNILQKDNNAVSCLMKEHHLLLGALKGNYSYPKKRLETEFSIRLKLSPTFFELCLKNNSEDLIHRSNFLGIPLYSTHSEENLSFIVKSKLILPKEHFYFDLIFEICVRMDALKGFREEVDLNDLSMPAMVTLLLQAFKESYLDKEEILYLRNQNHINDTLNPENIEVMKEKLLEYGSLLGITSYNLEDCSAKEIILLANFIMFDIELKKMEDEEQKVYPTEERVKAFKELVDSGDLIDVVRNMLTLTHPLAPMDTDTEET